MRQGPVESAGHSPHGLDRLRHEGVARRDFLKLMGASLAMAGLTACQLPTQTIVPYVRAPEDVTPGKPLYFATALSLGGVGVGVLVASYTGRPTKVEGNPSHPVSLGATDTYSQAAVLNLYDPERNRAISFGKSFATWEAFLDRLRVVLAPQQAKAGAGLRILTGRITSPTMLGQIQAILAQYPQAHWHQHEPVGIEENARLGASLAFGADVRPVYQLANAARVVSLDADFLVCTPSTLGYVHDFTKRRSILNVVPETNRLYSFASAPSNTSAVADHHWPVPASQVVDVARALATRLGVAAGPANVQGPIPSQQLDAVVKDLRSLPGQSLVIAGESQPPIVHALAAAMNVALGALGKTVYYTAPMDGQKTDGSGSLESLVDAMQAGQVEVLVSIGTNPAYTAPVDVDYAGALKKVPFSAHLSLLYDETAQASLYHIPQTHELEDWSDVRANDGTISIIQPLVAPLYGGHSPHELLASIIGQPAPPSHDVVRAYWQKQVAGGDFNTFWSSTLERGVVPNTALPAQPVALRPDFAAAIAAQLSPAAQPGQLEIVFRPDPNVYDGRFASNSWLQELPKPLTRTDWENVALISARTAERLGVATQAEANGMVAEVVELSHAGQTVRAPAWVIPGHADDSITVFLGYGRRAAGQVGTGIGYDAYRLRTRGAPWFDGGLAVRRAGDKATLASVQHHQEIEGGDLVRAGTLAGFQKDPNFAHANPQGEVPTTSIYPGYPKVTNQWGMAINLSACVGCNACVIACQAENNIPVVGKEQVIREREMHWLRIDHYYEGTTDNPATYFEPVPCMQCENAPCELVCPTMATVHSADGLNDMTYNRCVGTRYCSNNCPYKVRRFNFFEWSDFSTESLKALRNPEVTVRSRGVMEKCTYCVQRIRGAQINAEKEGRPIRDGEVLTACQAACPSQAITFGDLTDPNSQVVKAKASPLNFTLLAELNTRPRTTYLAAVRNPNPELERA